MPISTELPTFFDKWLEAFPYLAGAVITLMSGYLVARFNTKSSARQSRKTLLIERLEELDTYVLELHNHWQLPIFKLAHALTKNQARVGPEILKKLSSNEQKDTSRAHTLINFYFPELKTPYDTVRAASDALSEILLDIAMSDLPQAEDARSKLRERIVKRSNENEAAYHDWSQDIRKVANRILD